MPRPSKLETRHAGAVSYARQTLQHPSPIARLAHRRRHALGLALAAQHVRHDSGILDFGAGPGTFLHELGRRRPDLRLLGHEPFMALAYPEITRILDLGTLADASLAAVSAFEVCEHLTPAQIDGFLAQARRLLRPEGCLILSVPVMEGLALPLKEASRALLFRRASDYGPRDLIRGIFGGPVARPANILTSHKGFAHRALWRRVERDFDLVEARVSPFAALPWWVNSQRFGVFSPKPS